MHGGTTISSAGPARLSELQTPKPSSVNGSSLCRVYDVSAASLVGCATRLDR